MKHLLLLLFTTVCLAQNARVIVHRAFSRSTGIQCSIPNTLTSNEDAFVFRTKSEDTLLIRTLQKVKKNSLNWKKEKLSWNDNPKGNSIPICNMFIIISKEGNDTILTTANNYSIVLPEQKIQFIDKNQELNKSLTGDIKDFFKRDFRKDLLAFETGNLDSISPEKIICKSRLFSEITNDSIISLNSGFSFADHPIEGKNDSLYFFSVQKITNSGKFSEESRTEDILYLTVDKICLGDSESILLHKYPNSVQYQYPLSDYYKDLKNNYAYGVKIEDKKGLIVFRIKDKKIDAIDISYNP